MFPNAERYYRVSYLDGVYDVFRFAKMCGTHSEWIDALIAWDSLPQTNPADCPCLPGYDGSPSRQGTGWPSHTWQRARCRGYSQGLEAALDAIRAEVDPATRLKLEKWRDRVLQWRLKNSARTRRRMPSPPSY